MLLLFFTWTKVIKKNERTKKNQNIIKYLYIYIRI